MTARERRRRTKQYKAKARHKRWRKLENRLKQEAAQRANYKARKFAQDLMARGKAKTTP